MPHIKCARTYALPAEGPSVILDSLSNESDQEQVMEKTPAEGPGDLLPVREDHAPPHLPQCTINPAPHHFPISTDRCNGS